MKTRGSLLSKKGRPISVSQKLTNLWLSKDTSIFFNLNFQIEPKGLSLNTIYESERILSRNERLAIFCKKLKIGLSDIYAPKIDIFGHVRPFLNSSDRGTSYGTIGLTHKSKMSRR